MSGYDNSMTRCEPSLVGGTEFFIGGKAHGKTYSLRESIKKNFECGCMTDELLDSLMSEGSSIDVFECKHGLSVQFAQGGKVGHE